MEVIGVFGTERTLPKSLVGVNGHRERSAVRKGYSAAPALPQGPLRHRERRTPAARADPLVVAVGATRDLIGESELAFHFDQVLDVPARTECVAAAATVRRFLGSRDV